MSEAVRKPRRWPWILAIATALMGGCVGGVGMVSYLFVEPCPPLYQPLPRDGVVFRRGPDMVVPRPLGRPSGDVPAIGRVARIDAAAVVWVYVERDGGATRVALGRSSGFCPYDARALRDARTIRFVPGEWQGEPKAGWIDLRFSYRGRQPPPPARGPSPGDDI